ncbi:MAG TPA: helix-turn-helix domain-containing protein [Rhodocyclaceae bacterium]|nr:helix-turn-helix domain-containing protein [Rhodocyclaceae bacterium]
MSRPQFLTPQQLSERWESRIGVRTLANWRSQGSTGPRFIKIGGRVMYRLSDVEAWEQRRTTRSTSQYGQMA